MPNVVRVAMRFSIAETAVSPVPPGEITDVVMTYHAHAIDSHDPPDDDDLVAFAGITLGWWTDDGEISLALRARYLANTRLEDVTVHRVSPTLGDPLVYAVGTKGTFSGDVFYLPPQCAFLVGLRTTEESRSTRGRMYFPAFGGVPQSVNATGKIPHELRESTAQLVQELVRRIQLYEGPEPTWTLCVYSRLNDESLAVTHLDVPDRICTQRRRAYRPLVHESFSATPD